MTEIRNPSPPGRWASQWAGDSRMRERSRHTSHDMDMAQALFTNGERTAIGWSDRGDIANTIAEARAQERGVVIEACKKAVADELFKRNRRREDFRVSDIMLAIDRALAEPQEQI